MGADSSNYGAFGILIRSELRVEWLLPTLSKTVLIIINNRKTVLVPVTLPTNAF